MSQNPVIIAGCSFPNSKALVLAKAIQSHLKGSTVVDLAATPLPLCESPNAWDDQNVQQVKKSIENANAIVLCCPIYNYTTSSTVKTLIELTGPAWQDKVVGLAICAGGMRSHMAILPTVNSLMLDFRCLIIPRFVYATRDDFTQDTLHNPDIIQRIEQLAETLVTLSQAKANQ